MTALFFFMPNIGGTLKANTLQQWVGLFHMLNFTVGLGEKCHILFSYLIYYCLSSFR